MRGKKLQRLVVGKVSLSATDALFEIIRIAAVLQHFLIIVGFEKSCMALLELADQVRTGKTDIRKHAYFDFPAADGDAIKPIAILIKGIVTALKLNVTIDQAAYT